MSKVHNILLNKKVSLKENTLWYTLGTLCSSCSNVLLMIYVTRILGVDQAGVFSIAYSIAQLMLTIGWFSTRQFQVSDIDEEYSFSDYLAFKLFLSIVVIIGAFVYSGYLNLSPIKKIVTLAYCIFILCDVFADLFSSRFQQMDKLFISGISYLIRIIGYNVIFLLSLILFKNLLLSISLSLVYSCIELLFFDVPMIKSLSIIKLEFPIKKIGSLFIKCFPLFIGSFITTFIINIPKNAIELNFSSSLQTYYNIIFMPSSIVNMFCMFVFVPLYTNIATVWHKGTKNVFLSLVLKLMLVCLGLSVLILAGSYLLGIPFLQIVYGVDLSGYKTAFMILMCAGCMTSFNSIMIYIFTVIRKQKLILFVYIIAMALCQILINPLIQNLNLIGASLDYLIGMSVVGVLFLILFAVVMFKQKGEVEYE